ncbi:hypothetical protein JCM10213v2_000938 [Rhodosporidiobolus nylandii]
MRSVLAGEPTGVLPTSLSQLDLSSLAPVDAYDLDDAARFEQVEAELASLRGRMAALRRQKEEEQQRELEDAVDENRECRRGFTLDPSTYECVCYPPRWVSLDGRRCMAKCPDGWKHSGAGTGACVPSTSRTTVFL